MTREKASEILHGLWGCDYRYCLNDEEAAAVDMAIEALKQPEIIRCTDCKYAAKHGNVTWCDKLMCYGVDDWFCASARRKEE